MKNMSATKGTSRTEIFLIVDFSTAEGAAGELVVVSTMTPSRGDCDATASKTVGGRATKYSPLL